MMRVRLDPEKHPGVVACGPYLAGVEYEVDDELGRHLVEVKGFDAVGAGAPRHSEEE